MSETPRLKSVEQKTSPQRFGGLSHEKALAVAEQYLDPIDVATYLRPYLIEGRSIESIAYELGKLESESTKIVLQKLESQVAEAHLANIPRGYGHTAVILTIVRDQDTA